MADNVAITAGSGTSIATDDVGGVHYQKVKIDIGGDGASVILSNSNALPVSDAGSTLSVDDGGSTISIDDGAGSITVDGTVAVTNAGITTIAGAVAGTEMQVDIVAELPAGTNNIGDVDVVSVVPGTLAASLGKAEDALHSSGDVGVMMLAVRQNSQTALAGDGDYLPPTIDNSGGLRVSIVSGGGTGGTASTDDADFTQAGTTGTPVMGVYESTPTTVTDGDMGIVGITTSRELKVNVSSGGIAGRAEDSASAGGEDGIPILAVRRDSASSGVSADGDWANLNVDANGNLRVAFTGSAATTQYAEDVQHASGDSVVVMGAVRRDTAASSSGTDGDYSTVNTDSSGRVWVNASGAAVPVTDNSGSLTVDNGGTFAVQATVAASATSIAKAEDAQHASGETGVYVLAVRADTAASTATTDGDYTSLITDSTGKLHVNVGNTVTVGSHAVTNAGTFVVQENGAALTALQLIDNSSIADDASFSPATTGVTMAGFFADEAATDSVDEGDGGAARMTLDRKQIVTQYAHAAAGGVTPYYNLDVDETEDAVKASAGKLYWVHAVNLSATKKYLKFYNDTTANVTVGSTTPSLTLPIPTTADTNGCGFTIHFGDQGVQFTTAITIAATTGFADADTGAPGANEVIVNLGYL